jgi:ring-1,2-phenylacetyl-CoA epoxidase subunit PaaA
VTALCSPAGKGITGQLLGVRGREVFLFGLAAACRADRAGATLGQDLSAKFRTSSPTSPPISKPSTPNPSSEERCMSEPHRRQDRRGAEERARGISRGRGQAGDQPCHQQALRRAGVRRPAIAYAPTPYAKWLTCRVAMEEYGHHVRFKQLGVQMGIPEERMIPGAGKRPCRSSSSRSRPGRSSSPSSFWPTWPRSCRSRTCCTAPSIRSGTSRAPPCRRSASTLQFGEDFTAERSRRRKGKATLQAAIDRYFPYLPSFFGGSKSKNNEIFRKWNIKQRTNDEMRADFMKRARRGRRQVRPHPARGPKQA